MTHDKKSPLTSLLRTARLERGWSQENLAELIGSSAVNISRWENGLNFPSPYYRQRLSETFGLTPAELGLLPPPTPGTRLRDIPIARSPYFTGREPLLELLHRRLSTGRTAALTQPQALYGLGGIGKTQTAVEYAFRYGNEYTHVFWIRAATHETLIADFVKLAQLLDLAEKDEQDPSRVIVTVKRWLATNDGWLLILDNADDLPLAQGFLPTSHKGYLLFTTRAQASGTIAASVEVERLTQQEGSLLLLRWSKLLDQDAPLDQAHATDRAEALRIVQEMDGLPLALVQVGAYIEETGCSLGDYLRLYATHRKDLLAWHSRLMLDYSETVATTWSLSFQQIEQQSPAAADLLRLCAFLAPDAIPEELLTRGASELGPVLGPTAADQLKLNDALKVLRTYSLIHRNGNTHLLNIHRLVQTVLKESMDSQTQRGWAERTVRTVNAALSEIKPGTSDNQQYYLRYYLPQVLVCATLIQQYQLYFPEAAQLLFQAGAFLYFYGFHPQSQSLHELSLMIREQVLGPDHPDVAESLNALAIFFRLQGDYKQVEKLQQRALSIRQKAFGPHHPTTAVSLNNLGVLYRTLGKYEQAEPLLLGTIDINEQSLGSEHTDTLLSYINLAKLYIEQGKHEQAEQLLKQTLTTSEQALKPEHPFIAQSLDVLAKLYYEQGNFEQAEMLWKRSLALYEKTLGPEHPVTAGILNNLAALSFAQRRYTQARSFCQRALDINEKRLGPEHSDTITYREHLSRIVSKIEGERDGN